MDPRTGLILVIALATAICPETRADGKLVAPRDYEGSLEEGSQEAIIVFTTDEDGRGYEDLILKVAVSATPDTFGWVIPFPNEPTIEEADAVLFEELFKYVGHQKLRLQAETERDGSTQGKAESKSEVGVEVLSRKTVGSYETAVVRPLQAGALDEWLTENGFQTLEGAADVLGFYRERSYVFACVKVSGATLEGGGPVDLHPLRFKFETGGRDGIYFPMKMTGLQSTSFDANLYVFYKSWLNANLNRFGFEERGFHLDYRDWDTEDCKANAGKAWDEPEEDPLLAGAASIIPHVRGLFKTSYPGQRFYLTRLHAYGLEPATVRHWPDDLWLFPHYAELDRVPFDAQKFGPVEGLYHCPCPPARYVENRTGFLQELLSKQPGFWSFVAAVALLGALVGALLAWAVQKRRRKAS